MMLTTQEQAAITPSNHDKKLRFVETLKRFNAKERNFLMRYVLSASLSSDFLKDLVEHLGKIGFIGLDGAKAVYWGMDYHFEWINASLLLATGELTLEEGKTPPKFGGQTGRIEDVDLMVVLQKADHNLVLILIEAKGVTSFDTLQFGSKVNRLEELRKSAVNANDWLESVMLIMSPEMSRPNKDNCLEFAKELAKPGVEFWPSTVPAVDSQLIWMDLKNFFVDMEKPERALRISTCYESGERAANLDARNETKYDHWRVEPRHVVKKKR